VLANIALHLLWQLLEKVAKSLEICAELEMLTGGAVINSVA